ncbi:hypothetical protein F6Y04_00065 [Bacillus megaterium]|nr:hypothetical protein [Priestia megaterium]
MTNRTTIGNGKTNTQTIAKKSGKNGTSKDPTPENNNRYGSPSHKQ